MNSYVVPLQKPLSMCWVAMRKGGWGDTGLSNKLSGLLIYFGTLKMSIIWGIGMGKSRTLVKLGEEFFFKKFPYK